MVNLSCFSYVWTMKESTYRGYVEFPYFKRQVDFSEVENFLIKTHGYPTEDYYVVTRATRTLPLPESGYPYLHKFNKYPPCSEVGHQPVAHSHPNTLTRVEIANQYCKICGKLLREKVWQIARGEAAQEIYLKEYFGRPYDWDGEHNPDNFT